jgi:hypothetical protein
VFDLVRAPKKPMKRKQVSNQPLLVPNPY